MTTAELEAFLSLDDKQFIAALMRSEKKAKDSAKNIGTAFGGISGKLGAVFSVSAAAAGFRVLTNFADEISDLASTTQQTTSEFQQFTFAVEQAGGTQEAYIKTIIGIQQAMEQAKDGTGDAYENLRKLNVTMDQITRGDAVAVFLQIADAMKESGGDGETFAAVADLIGIKVATKMIPSLKMGSEEFKELATSATVASEQAVKAAADANDAIDAMFRDAKAGGLEFLNWLTNAYNEISGVNDLMNEQAARMFDKTWKPGPSGFPEKEVEPEEFTTDARSGLGKAQEKANKRIADQKEKDAKELAAFQEDWNEQIKRHGNEINEISRERFEIEKEIRREGLSTNELITDLTRERNHYLQQALNYEKDIFQLHRKDAAAARLEAVKLQQQINAQKNQLESNYFDPMELPPQVINDATRGFRPSLSSLTSGGLTTGGLSTGGLNGGGENAHSLVRRGDAAKAKAAAREAANSTDPLTKAAQATARNTANMAKAWGTGGTESP